jgi:hypothetical protein
VTLRRRLGRLVTGGAERTPVRVPGVAQHTGGTRGKGLRAKPPNVVGRGPLLGGPGFGVVVVCIVKDEAEYLEEWLAYHVALGVDHFIVYDNGSTDGSAELLERYINHGLVTRIDWPLGGGQLAAYNHSLRMFGATARWLAYYDVDEFLVPLIDDDIPTFLARFEEAAVVRVPRVEFGFSGHRQRPQSLSLDAYTQVANVLELDPTLPPRVKSVVQPGAVSAVDIHLAFPADVPAPHAPTRTAEESVRGVAQLNHYYTRSFEEFEEKRFRGSATGRIARPAVPFDIATIEEDSAARRFSERTQATLDRLRRLETKPYAYGSRLALPYFPRPNDLFRFGEFAIANTAAGWEEPGRVAASRLRNLHTGIGVVADLAGTDYQPVRAGLSSTVHVEALVRHMRGRMEAALDTDLGWAGGEPGGGLAPFTVGGDPPGEDAGAGPLALDTGSGPVEVLAHVTPGDTLRCHYLGFVTASEAPVRLECWVELEAGGDGADVSAAGDGRTEPLVLELPASRCLAGVVELSERPSSATAVRVRVESAGERVDLYDLFAISTG